MTANGYLQLVLYLALLLLLAKPLGLYMAWVYEGSTWAQRKLAPSLISRPGQLPGSAQ